VFPSCCAVLLHAETARRALSHRRPGPQGQNPHMERTVASPGTARVHLIGGGRVPHPPGHGDRGARARARWSSRSSIRTARWRRADPPAARVFIGLLHRCSSPLSNNILFESDNHWLFTDTVRHELGNGQSIRHHRRGRAVRLADRPVGCALRLSPGPRRPHPDRPRQPWIPQTGSVDPYVARDHSRVRRDRKSHPCHSQETTFV